MLCVLPPTQFYDIATFLLVLAHNYISVYTILLIYYYYVAETMVDELRTWRLDDVFDCYIVTS